jgi:hypothetical protein
MLTPRWSVHKWAAAPPPLQCTQLFVYGKKPALAAGVGTAAK